MPRRPNTPEEILQHLRTVELALGKGLPVLDACRKLGMTEQTYDRWKKEYGGLRMCKLPRQGDTAKGELLASNWAR